MLQHTDRRELGINSMIKNKFGELAEKLGLDQGMSLLQISELKA
jgi:hypothetical protein